MNRRIPLPPALKNTVTRQDGGANPEALLGAHMLDLLRRQLPMLALDLANRVTPRNYRKIQYTWRGAIKLAALLCGHDKSLWPLRHHSHVQRLYANLRNPEKACRKKVG